MEKYTLDTDFSSLKGSQTYDWMLEFSDMVEEAFAEKDNRFCLLGNLLFMEIYVHTIRKGLTNRNEPLSAILQKALDIQIQLYFRISPITCMPVFLHIM